MENIIKYVRNRNPLNASSDSGGTPYINLEDNVSMHRSNIDLTTSTNYSSTVNNTDVNKENENIAEETTENTSEFY